MPNSTGPLVGDRVEVGRGVRAGVAVGRAMGVRGDVGVPVARRVE